MFKIMTKFVNSHNLLQMKQYGFCENHSTQHAITALMSDFLSGFKDNFYTLVLFIDLRKAFDIVDRKILLGKPKGMGFGGIVLQWFESYLCNSKQYTVINNENSTELTITHGVPQGGVLAPQLFFYI